MEKQEQDFVKEFESMKDFAELKALSNVSLERPLSDEEFERIMELKKKCIGGKIR